MIRATIARMAASSRDESERTDASTPSASMIRAASFDCGFGPACRKRRGSTASAALAVTGVAGPGGGTAAKPVGTVWLAWAGPGGTVTECHHFKGDRDTIRRATVETSLQRLHALLMLARPGKGM